MAEKFVFGAVFGAEAGLHNDLLKKIDLALRRELENIFRKRLQNELTGDFFHSNL